MCVCERESERERERERESEREREQETDCVRERVYPPAKLPDCHIAHTTHQNLRTAKHPKPPYSHTVHTFFFQLTHQVGFGVLV